MINSTMLLNMSRIDIDKIDPSTLANIDTIKINQSLPHEEKVLSFIQQMGNPYCFISGGVPVNVRFVGSGKTLSESLTNYFSLLKQK